MDRLTGNHEGAFPSMMNRPRMFLPWVNPGYNNPKDKEIVFRNHRLIDDPAFKIGVAFVDKRRIDAQSGHWREPELLELVDRSS
jgi:hypothetical protein